MPRMSDRTTSLFGVRYPLVQAGMIWCSGWRLAAAVSNAGGLLAPDRMAYVDVLPTLSVSVGDIKAELATRPHVPNKAEAKKLRQRAAHEKKNR